MSAAGKSHKPLQLVGIAEVAALAGLPRGTVRVWHSRGKLPEPAARLAAGPVWERATIEAWKEELCT